MNKFQQFCHLKYMTLQFKIFKAYKILIQIYTNCISVL